MARCRIPGIICLSALACCHLHCTHHRKIPTLSQAAVQVEIVEQYWADGTPRLRKELVPGPNGKLINHGTYARWHKNGSKAYEATFVRGKKEGIAILWHENGRKWAEEHYLDGQKHGPRYVWDENGTKRKEEHFFEGKPHGTWAVWNDKGRIKSLVHFEHGRPLP